MSNLRILPIPLGGGGSLPNYGASISMSIDNDYVLSVQLLDQNGNALGAEQTVDLPLESVVVNGSYDSNTKSIILTLENGNTVTIPVGDLVSGLQTEITSQNPLSADLLTDGTNNKVYTADEKTKLSGIQTGAQVNPANVSAFNNDAGYLTQDSVIINQAFPSGWHTSGTLSQLITDINADNTAVKGKSYLSTVSFSDLPASLVQGEMTVQIMDEMAGTGKVILFTLTSSATAPYHWEYTSAWGGTSQWRAWALSTDVVNADWNATSGNAEILNKPTIPDAQVNSDWNATSGKAEILNKPTIPDAQVNSDWNATSGKAEILNKPTIPTVNDATITVHQDGQADQTFTLNQSGDQTINIAAAGGGSNAWYGTQAQFDALGTYDDDTDYFITDKLDYNTDLKNTPNLGAYATKAEVNTKNTEQDNAISEKMGAQFMTQQEFDALGQNIPEGKNFFIEGTTVEMIVTFTDQSTATYNIVVD